MFVNRSLCESYKNTSVSTAIVCQQSMSDVMNKVEMCGKGIKYITSQHLFAIFCSKANESGHGPRSPDSMQNVNINRRIK